MCETGIKICGMRRKEDIEAANACRPDYIGFILSPGFRRSVTPEDAELLARRLAPGILKVGVFVNRGRAATTNDPRGRLLIQAFRIRSADDLKRAKESEADYLLLDNGTGTGEAFDWSLISDAEVLMCGEAAKPWILAGGLGPDNVAEAVRRFKPFAVDLSSGAETDGWKDPEKMARCVQAVREAGRENSR